MLIALAGVSVVTATALGQDDRASVPAAEFGEDVPQLLPMTAHKPAASTTAISRGGIDELALIGALYWLALAGVALRRSRRGYSVSTAA